ncbi:enoyl-CoA hydratase-related protein [Streptomyces muensis]|uniref:Enoyl-CoA hydratase-related protein n=1 Tax=Streptomyces muensis TaxID=1077944 RepID=A0A9X1Q9X7_STRM4|nr:enoyl-CoA hydratase-related protein [Streptomyces muensis]MCF1600529.1 enoyl-CoA hydratase-related protein [Streptomyces muensis]
MDGGGRAGERAAGDREADGRAARDREADGRAARDREANGRAARDREANEQTAHDRRADERAAGDRRVGERAAGDRRVGEQAAGDREADGQAVRDRRAGEQAAHDREAGEQTAADRIPGDVARTIRLGAQRLIAAVLDCEKPVIAAVNGTAAGLGAHLAFACDLVLAAESARFIEVFVRRGLVPDGGGAYLLPRLIGPQRAKELMFFGDALGAADAERLGLVNRVVPDGELDKTARAWAERLATGPTRTLALTKQLVNASLDTDRTTAFAAEAAAQEINMTTQDAQEGVASFVERRSAEYKGR